MTERKLSRECYQQMHALAQVYFLGDVFKQAELMIKIAKIIREECHRQLEAMTQPSEN